MFWLFACAPNEARAPQTTEAVPDPAPGGTPVTTPTATGPVRVNEVMPRNDSTWIDPVDGQASDWIELVNTSEEAIAWSRITLSDGGSGHWVGGDGTLEPMAHAILGSGTFGFGLDSDEDLVAVSVDGEASDQVTWVDMGRDIALARIPDVTGDWTATAWPTPGDPNSEVPSPTLDAADGTVFLSDSVHVISFEIAPDQYDLLAEGSGFIGTFADYKEVEASLTIDGFEYPLVGIRRKGSASADALAGKPPFRVDLNEFVPGTRFRSLKGFNLNNGKVYDPTLVHEHLSYRLARELGLAAPRVGWATVEINGLDYGIYTFVEQHDDVFIERFFPGAGDRGAILEPNESSGGGFLSFGDFGYGSLNWDYEEGPTPPDPAMIAILEDIDALVDGAATDAAVAELWTRADKQAVLTYFAWENVIGHTDGYHAPNNWRVYLDPDTRLMHLVPTGSDWTWDTSADPWQWGGSLATWCLSNAGCAEDLADEMVNVADQVDALDLLADFDRIWGGIQGLVASQPRPNHSDFTVDASHDRTREALVAFPNTSRSAACTRFPGVCGP